MIYDLNIVSTSSLAVIYRFRFLTESKRSEDTTVPTGIYVHTSHPSTHVYVDIYINNNTSVIAPEALFCKRPRVYLITLASATAETPRQHNL